MRAIYIVESNDNGHWDSVCVQEDAEWKDGVFLTREEANAALAIWRESIPIPFRVVKYVPAPAKKPAKGGSRGR